MKTKQRENTKAEGKYEKVRMTLMNYRKRRFLLFGALLIFQVIFLYPYTLTARS